MDWNNYFMSRSNQNFNFVPGGFPPANNGAMFQNNDQNWQYYGAYNQNYLSEPSTLQHVIPPVVTPPYGAFTPASRDVSENSIRSGVNTAFPGGVGLGMSESFNPPTDALSSILSASSLTPTAGEFVPRSKSVIQSMSEHGSLSHDSQTAAPTLSNSQHQSMGQNSVMNTMPKSVSLDMGGIKKKINSRKFFSNSNNNDQKDQSQAVSSGEKRENVDNKVTDLVDKSPTDCQLNVSTNSASNSGASKKMLNGNLDSKPKSERNSSLDEFKIVPSNNISSTRQGQSAPVRRGSGRILQSRGNENPRGSNFRESISHGRQHLLAEASTYYSSNFSEGRTGPGKGNGGQKGANDQQSSPRDSFYGKYSRDQNDRYYNSGKGFFKNYGKEDVKILEGKGNVTKEGESSVNEKFFTNQCSGYKGEKVERSERDKTSRNDKSSRSDQLEKGDRQNKRDRQDRSDRLDKQGKQERSNRQERQDRQDRQDKSDRQDRQDKSDRQDRQDKSDRQDRQDKSDRQDRQDKSDRQDRQDKSDRHDMQDNADRQDRSDRQDRNYFQDRVGRQDRNYFQDRGDRQDRNYFQDRGDRQDRNYFQDRGDRQDRNYFQDRGDRQDRREKQDKDDRSDHGGRMVPNVSERGDMPDTSEIRSFKGERSFREEKFDREYSDRGNRCKGDKSDRSNWMDRDEKQDRGIRTDRGERLGRGDRQDRTDRLGRGDREDRGERNLRSERSEPMERGDRSDSAKQKSFFNNRFKTFDSSPGRREERSDNVPFFQNKAQKYGSNQHSRGRNQENEVQYSSKGESNPEYQSLEQNRDSPESDKNSNKSDHFSASKTSNGFDRDKNCVVSDRNNSPRVTYFSDAKARNLNYSQFQSADDDASQRERLSDQLSRGALECLVCCDRVRQHDAVWSCSNCYHVLHLRCIKKWAKSSKIESGWRCPACQNVTSKVPQEYKCFCGKMRDPEWNRQDLPHTCGEMCGRARKTRGPELGACTHRCTLLCHPGPCPPCVAQVSRSCGCGKKSQIVSCGNSQPLLCEEPCNKLLNCGLHQCVKTCHWGPCGDCEQIVKQECYCGKALREVACTTETATADRFSCQEVCARTLACANHSCALVCHEGACTQCKLTPEHVSHCPCGKTPLAEACKRASCLDPVPTCGQPCEKRLNCGQPGMYHECRAECHSGPCPVCPLTTFVKCRCGHMDREIECKELKTKADDARCEKRCSKKRACGKHKCNQACCIDMDHQCPLPCNHTLSCGQHKCEDLCHRGHCQPCWRTSFEELYCECGANVIYPPVPCGTRRPACSNPCSRRHPCEHQALHQCHSEPTCPPCAVLMERYCYGKHELRKAVPCHRTEFSCGMPCGLPLPCGRHSCILPCHKGPCVRDGQPVCSQPCKTTRQLCGHPCAAPCHTGICPDTPCKETVRVTCECGHRSTTRPCCDQTKEYRRVLTTLLASKMQEVQQGLSVDLGDLSGNSAARAMSLKTLDCNDECKIIERNRRLAIGLQIRNPDLGSKLQPRYSEFMRQWGKKDPFFVSMVQEKLTELVQLAKQSKQKSRSYSFSSMNREKRHFIHEYCEHFGCESQAYDPEPNRNVVATAQRDRAWLPSMSLLEVLQRESGQRKVPKPVTARAVDTKIRETLNWRTQAKPEDIKNDKECNKKEHEHEQDKDKESNEQEKKEEVEEIDYFEMTS